MILTYQWESVGLHYQLYTLSYNNLIQVNGKLQKANFLDRAIEVKGENHHEVAYLLATILLQMKKISNFSSGMYQQISVKDDNFLKVYNAWESGDDDRMCTQHSLATEHYIESMVDTKMVTENLHSSGCSSTSDQQECYVKHNGPWTDLSKYGTFPPSRGSDLRPVMEKVFGHVSFQPKQEQALDSV